LVAVVALLLRKPTGNVHRNSVRARIVACRAHIEVLLPDPHGQPRLEIPRRRRHARNDRLTSLDSPFQTVVAGTTLKMISRILD
jgi:hypothetical protein